VSLHRLVRAVVPEQPRAVRMRHSTTNVTRHRFYRPRREYPQPPPKRITNTIMMRMVVVLIVRRPVGGRPCCSNRSACVPAPTEWASVPDKRNGNFRTSSTTETEASGTPVLGCSPVVNGNRIA
jgi:hypothetical protein